MCSQVTVRPAVTATTLRVVSPLEPKRMIARHWRGWTKLADASAYEKLLTDTVLPALKNIEGYQGGYILRQDDDREAEFVVINFFDSLESVKRFAGDDYGTPAFEPEAKRLLSRIEYVAHHVEVRARVQ
jgi:heme-degrading monooxygenase HmoA